MTFLAGASVNEIEVTQFGRTIAKRLIFELDQGDYCVTLDDLRTAHEGFFPALMG
jgi:phosphoribosylformylglycinamidine synthase